MSNDAIASDLDQERVLRFSPDYSLGTLLVKPHDAGDEERWSTLGEACWSVLLPHGMSVRLWIGPNVTDADLAALSALPADGLRELILMNRPIGDTGVQHLAGLTGLRALDLYGTKVTDAACDVIGGLSGLQWLSFTSTHVTDAGVRRLVALHELRRLSLKKTQVTDESLAVLAQMPNLAWLSLTDTRVGDAGLRSLADLAALRELSVLQTLVTAAGLSWWARRRPDVALIEH